MPYKPWCHAENIDNYMRRVEKCSMISTDREKELSVIIHGTDQAAADKAVRELVTSNLRLVIKIAHDFKQYKLGFADLVSEGNLGLITAARKYLPDKGAKFSCYAAWWIKQAMRKAIAETTRTIRLPTEQAKRQIEIEKARRRWSQEHAAAPTVSDIAAITGLTESSIRILDNAAVCSASINEYVCEDSETQFESLFAATDPQESRIRRMRFNNLDTLIAGLPCLERELICYTYGIKGITANPQLIAQETGLKLCDITEKLKDCLSSLGCALRDLEERFDP